MSVELYQDQTVTMTLSAALEAVIEALNKFNDKPNIARCEVAREVVRKIGFDINYGKSK